MLVGHGGLVVAAQDALQEEIEPELLRRFVDTQGRHPLLKIDQGLVVGAGTPDPDRHARQILDGLQRAAGLRDQVLVHVEVGHGEGRPLLALGRDRQAAGDDVPFALQQPGHHLGEAPGLDQLQLQLEGLRQAVGDVVVEGDPFAEPGQVIDRLGGNDDAQDAALLQLRQVTGVPRRGRQDPRSLFLGWAAAPGEGAKGKGRESKRPRDGHGNRLLDDGGLQASNRSLYRLQGQGRWHVS